MWRHSKKDLKIRFFVYLYRSDLLNDYEKTLADPFGCSPPSRLPGDAPQCLFQTYSTLDGMTHDRIADIYTDSRGFVWVCTWYGVSRFDGYTFKNFSTTPGDFSPCRTTVSSP